MKSWQAECFYRNPSNPLIQKLGDLKIEYALTKSNLIKSLLNQAEELILMRVGTKEMLLDRMKTLFNLTQEERVFCEKLKKLLN